MPRFTAATLFLVLVNIGFFAAGILLLNFTSSVEESGWIDALDGTEYHSTGQKGVGVAKSMGYAVLVLSVMGTIGAISRQRVLLLIYSIIMIAVMTIFGVVAIAAAGFKSRMQDWEDNEFPAEADETSFGEKFNEAYCYAQGAYFCNNASASDVIRTFVPEIPDEVLMNLPQVQGINAVCDQAGELASSIDSACTACKQAKRFAKYDRILTWAEEKCPRTAETQVYCATFLSTGEMGEVYVGSPYKECRGRFLDIAISWSSNLFWTGLFGTFAAILIICLSCAARRNDYSSTEGSKV